MDAKTSLPMPRRRMLGRRWATELGTPATLAQPIQALLYSMTIQKGSQFVHNRCKHPFVAYKAIIRAMNTPI